jgi:hypothetical protein
MWWKTSNSVKFFQFILIISLMSIVFYTYKVQQTNFGKVYNFLDTVIKGTKKTTTPPPSPPPTTTTTTTTTTTKSKEKLNSKDDPSLVFRLNQNGLKQKKFAYFSCILTELNDFYMFHLPMAAVSWRRLGHEPIIGIVSSDFDNLPKIALKTIEYLNLFEIQMVKVPCEKDYDVVTAMVGRIFCGLLPDDIVGDDDFIFLTDSDIYPISFELFKIDDVENKIISLNGFCCGNFQYKNQSVPMRPMGYIGMKKIHFRSMLNLDIKTDTLNSDTIKMKISEIKNISRVWKMNKNIGRGSETWYF